MHDLAPARATQPMRISLWTYSNIFLYYRSTFYLNGDLFLGIHSLWVFPHAVVTKCHRLADCIADNSFSRCGSRDVLCKGNGRRQLQWVSFWLSGATLSLWEPIVFTGEEGEGKGEEKEERKKGKEREGQSQRQSFSGTNLNLTIFQTLTPKCLTLEIRPLTNEHWWTHTHSVHDKFLPLLLSLIINTLEIVSFHTEKWNRIK